MKVLFLPVILISYIVIFIFSYLWVDPNLTFINFGPANLINNFQSFGYYHREWLSLFYLVILLFLFGIQIYFLFSSFAERKSRKFLFCLAGGVVALATFAYPFLSHDFFSYLFHAKIIWFYHQNPHLARPDQFLGDPWLRFTHWTQQVSPYGPVWDLYILAPALFSFQKFILNFYNLKLINGICFFATGILLLRLMKDKSRVCAFWFFNPFLLIELLINAHNDLLMITLFIVSLYLIDQKKIALGFFAFLLSALSGKYISLFLLPTLFLNKDQRVVFFSFATVLLLLYLITNPMGLQIQAWYFSWIYLMLPFIDLSKLAWLVIFAINTLNLVGYYLYLVSGNWLDSPLLTVIRVLVVMGTLTFFELQFNFRQKLFKLRRA